MQKLQNIDIILNLSHAVLVSHLENSMTFTDLLHSPQLHTR